MSVFTRNVFSESWSDTILLVCILHCVSYSIQNQIKSIAYCNFRQQKSVINNGIWFLTTLLSTALKKRYIQHPVFVLFKTIKRRRKWLHQRNQHHGLLHTPFLHYDKFIVLAKINNLYLDLEESLFAERDRLYTIYMLLNLRLQSNKDDGKCKKRIWVSKRQIFVNVFIW